MLNIRTTLFVLILFGLLASAAWGQNSAPVLNPMGTPAVRERDFTNLLMMASDPEGDLLNYSWNIESDPTGKAYLFMPGGTPAQAMSGTNMVRLALENGPSYPQAESFQGMVIRVRVDVSDGQPDGLSSYVYDVRTSGINREPVLEFSTVQLGTYQQPRMENQGLAVNASNSWDPDGGEIHFLWSIVDATPTCVAPLVLFAKETPNPSLVVPQVPYTPNRAGTVTLEYVVEDGLIRMSGRFTGYVASPNGCSSSTTVDPPSITTVVATPNPASFGQTVSLTGNATGTAVSHSWKQMATTGGPAVAINSADSRIATFVAPDTPQTLSFEYVASNSAGTDTKTVNVYVTGDEGSPGGESNEGNGSTVPAAVGESDCSDPENQPAEATVAANYEVDGGAEAEITVGGGTDPDNTTAFVSGIFSNALSYQWSVLDGAGVLGDSDLNGTSEQTVRFRAPEVSEDTHVMLEVFVQDAAGCGTRYPVDVLVNATENPNQPPMARLHYQLDDNEVLPAPVEPVVVMAPIKVTLDASQSSDPDGTLTTGFNLERNLTSGGALFIAVGDQPIRTLVIQDGTQGTLKVSLVVTDDQGAKSNTSIQFIVEDESSLPVGVAAAYADNTLIETGEGVEEGSVVTLDGSDSRLKNGAKPATLEYEWRQISGLPVSLAGFDEAAASFQAPEVDSVRESLVFELIVRDGELTSEPVQVPVEVVVAPLYFSQIAFGPLLDEEFQTSIVLINHHDEPEENVSVEFFGPDGEPMEVYTQEGPWNSDDLIRIGANSSLQLDFFGGLGESLKAGWGRVVSDQRLTGLVLYRLLDAESRDLNSEVSLFASSRGSRFATFYSRVDGLGAAIANPGEEEAHLMIKLVEEESGSELTRATASVVLPPGGHMAQFLDEGFFDGLPDEFETGTLRIETLRGRVAVTVLKTRQGVAISTLPLSVRN